jgi:glycosyltransferase involved in cell wall biosynthesis
MGSDLLGTPDWDGRLTWFSRLVIHVDRLLARLADRVIVKSPEMAEIVAPVGADVLPNGVDMEAFCPLDRDEARARLGWRRDGRYVLFGSNPRNPRKGFPLAEKAVARVRERIGDVDMAALWGVAADDVPVYMSAADVLLMTSLLEGSPNVVKEAMACRLPVVAVPVGDVRELLEGVVASRVCKRDPEVIALALEGVLRAPIRTNGREALLDKGLDLANVAKRLVGNYEGALEDRGRSQRGTKENATSSPPTSGFRPRSQPPEEARSRIDSDSERNRQLTDPPPSDDGCRVVRGTRRSLARHYGRDDAAQRPSGRMEF